MPEDGKRTRPQILPSGDLRTLFVDNLQVSTRNDGMHLVQLFASLPDGWSEQARLLISDAHLKSMLEVLTDRCKAWEEGSSEG